jgi:head-tail adaptor
MAAVPKIGSMDITMQIMRRDLLQPVPGSAEPRHSYTPILTTRAAVTTMAGTTEFSRVDINGTRVTHRFTIRYTTIPFDVRNRIRDARGKLYQILSVSNVDLANKLMHIHCANIGDETVAAAL